MLVPVIREKIMKQYSTSLKNNSDQTIPRKHKLPVRTLIAASSGNAIEWFDWTIYAIFAVYFSTQFFPKGNDNLALINTYATFALAFFLRPLGGIVIGRFADLKGRKPAMILTICMMAGGSAVIGFLPTFEQIGWVSPILLLVARAAQGMSLGGEVSNASSYVAEIAPNDRRGRYSSFYYISTGTAVLAASLLGFVFTRFMPAEDLMAYGWRIPFFIGGFLAIAALWLRRAMPESDEFKKHEGKAEKITNPWMLTIRKYPKSVMQIVGLSMLNTLAYYTYFAALVPFATRQRGADGSDVFMAMSIGTVVFILLQYPFGALSDRIGRKPMIMLWAVLTAVSTVPLSHLVTNDAVMLTLVFSFGLGTYAVYSSISSALMSELFPTSIRATGIGIWLNLTVAIFGGTASLVITLLGSWGYPTAFFWYVTAAAVIAFITALSLKETNGAALQ